MPRRKHYPPQIQRIYQDDAPGVRNTSKQLAAAQEIEDKWGEDTTFTDLGQSGEYSRSLYQKVWHAYFGPSSEDQPLDRDLSFNEIRDQYGSIDAYYEQLEQTQSGGGLFDGDQISRDEVRAAQLGYQLAREHIGRRESDDSSSE